MEHQKLVSFLKERITLQTPLGEIVAAFEEMCQTPIDEDMILFETGSFDFFEGEPPYLFSLVRQFPNNMDDEFYQLHVDILYPSDESAPEETTWSDDVEGNIFDHIRASAAYVYAERRKPIDIRIEIEET